MRAAVSADQSTIYVAVSDGFEGYLLGLDSSTLARKYKTTLLDPSNNQNAIVFDDSSGVSNDRAGWATSITA